MKPRALQHEGQLIPYEIQHKPAVKRRIHLRTAPDGSLLVIAPRRMSKRDIHTSLQERVNHVARFLAGARKRQRETPSLCYINDEHHLFLGQYLPIKLAETETRAGQVSLMDNTISVSGSDLEPDQVKKLLTAWYRARAADYFAARMEVIASQAPWVKATIPSIRLRKMKRTWGSCSARGIITLNTRLIKTPPDCIDYVIAHELCHLKEMNHGKAFYALQAELFPAWVSARRHLREKAHLYLVD